MEDLASKMGSSEATGVITSVRTNAVYIVTYLLLKNENHKN